MDNQQISTLVIMAVFIVAIYFLMIRPQKKKDKEVADMRNNIRAGDEIVTIGGFCGKVVKTKEDSIVIQIGADKVKLEIKKWGISTVEKKATRTERVEQIIEEEKKVKPKRLLGKKASSMEEELHSAAAEVESAADEVIDDVTAQAAEAVEIAESLDN